eukprot:scaffold292369_cov35-Prasinocladus_malaysianus.AAC.2
MICFVSVVPSQSLILLLTADRDAISTGLHVRLVSYSLQEGTGGIELLFLNHLSLDGLPSAFNDSDVLPRKNPLLGVLMDNTLPADQVAPLAPTDSHHHEKSTLSYEPFPKFLKPRMTCFRCVWLVHLIVDNRLYRIRNVLDLFPDLKPGELGSCAV